MTDKEKLIDELTKLVEDTNTDLDDLVHEIVSQTASAINNDGPRAQVEFLLDECGEEVLREHIAEPQ